MEAPISPSILVSLFKDSGVAPSVSSSPDVFRIVARGAPTIRPSARSWQILDGPHPEAPTRVHGIAGGPVQNRYPGQQRPGGCGRPLVVLHPSPSFLYRGESEEGSGVPQRVLERTIVVAPLVDDPALATDILPFRGDGAPPLSEPASTRDFERRVHTNV